MKKRESILFLGFLTISIFLSGCTVTYNNIDKPLDDGGTEESSDNQEVETLCEKDMTWDEVPEMTIDESKKYFVTIKTNMGDMKVELWADKAPKTVNNFLFLTKEGFYDKLIFHRVVADFMIQGGDRLCDGTGNPGYSFEDEIHEENKNDKYTIAMANSGPDTNGSQFFINVKDNNFLDTKHTVFGKVIEGMEVADEIALLETDDEERPFKDVVFEGLLIEEE